MRSPVLIVLVHGNECIVNEDQVCYVSSIPESTSAKVHLSNGDVLRCASPTYEEWKNDLHVKK